MKMRVVDFLLDQLVMHKVTDMFGIPGGVVLDFLYAQQKRKNEIEAHLLFHEQDAAYAAVGYAQAEQRLGVAFATKGPGILNMVTTVADAYHDSVPLLIITAHASLDHPKRMRVMDEQEVDTEAVFRSVSKAVIQLEDIYCAEENICRAYRVATEGRPGPVVLDVYAKLWNAELQENIEVQAAQEISGSLSAARRPVLLIGDGVRQARMESCVRSFAERNGIPVLSSRGAQDIMPDSSAYFGYVGSHGIRYANFILSKTDCILALGNRLAFPVHSKSFGPIFERAKLLRVEIDPSEFRREIHGSRNYALDLRALESFLSKTQFQPKEDWLQVCNTLRQELWDYDMETPARLLSNVLHELRDCKVIVGDVGNHEFWLSRAYVYARSTQRILYSRSLGVLGCSLGKAIGAYYSCHRPIACICGDQGFQYHLPELQYVSRNHLPIWIVVVNNHSSGMIKTRQNIKYQRHFLTTEASGYSTPDFERIAGAYDIPYRRVCVEDSFFDDKPQMDGPHFVEITVDEAIDLEMRLPVGLPCQDMSPEMDVTLYEQLNAL